MRKADITLDCPPTIIKINSEYPIQPFWNAFLHFSKDEQIQNDCNELLLKCSKLKKNICRFHLIRIILIGGFIFPITRPSSMKVSLQIFASFSIDSPRRSLVLLLMTPSWLLLKFKKIHIQFSFDSVPDDILEYRLVLVYQHSTQYQKFLFPEYYQ